MVLRSCHRQIRSFLFHRQEHDKKLLMSIRTPGVERYLQKGDPELLFRHYMLSKDYPKVRCTAPPRPGASCMP